MISEYGLHCTHDWLIVESSVYSELLFVPIHYFTHFTFLEKKNVWKLQLLEEGLADVGLPNSVHSSLLHTLSHGDLYHQHSVHLRWCES